MKSMTQIARAAAGLRRTALAGRLQGVLRPAVFGCPYGHTAGIVTAPLPLGRCTRCAAPLTLLDGGLPPGTLRRAG